MGISCQESQGCMSASLPTKTKAGTVQSILIGVTGKTYLVYAQVSLRLHSVSGQAEQQTRT
jgi:hypothetical protein